MKTQNRFYLFQIYEFKLKWGELRFRSCKLVSEILQAYCNQKAQSRAEELEKSYLFSASIDSTLR